MATPSPACVLMTELDTGCTVEHGDKVEVHGDPRVTVKLEI